MTSPVWETPLGALRRGRHALLYHRGPDLAARVAARFAADGLGNEEAVVLSAEPVELERIGLMLSGTGVDVERERDANNLLFVQSDTEQASRLAVDVKYLVGWIREQARDRQTRIWNHWSGALAENGKWTEGSTLEASLGELKGDATVFCHIDIERMPGDPVASLEMLGSLHDALFTQTGHAALEFRDHRVAAVVR